MMNYEDWISYRYLTAKKGGFLAFLHIVSISGVAIGVMSLIVVIGVMTGFGNNLREKIIGTTPHIALEKETTIVDFSAVQRKVEKVKEVPFGSGRPNEMEKHNKFLRPTETEQLTLVTCGGANFSIWNKRVYVVAKPLNPEP